MVHNPTGNPTALTKGHPKQLTPLTEFDFQEPQLEIPTANRPASLKNFSILKPQFFCRDTRSPPDITSPNIPKP
ncbi:hypothetical protein BDA96_09G105300 [Sorghum bicolor]|uniref:Uncharacterized protein n=2 Tax=Sorghum bicolor TaxID=4558 RepID=A0A921Q9T3_SORBI|nr:hypothetical protein BDA96_09G105300 [Sorghum bicolor]KXG21734.1 hypothetical protein SORBI_3009G101500 [Sorghum bicolor]